LTRHRRPEGRHRAHKPPHNKAPAVLASAVVGATAAALSTAAASGDGLQAMAASVTALQAPVPDTALGMGGPEPLPADVAAEVPMNGRTLLAATAAKSRVATIQATRAARARQLALIEAARPKWLPPLPKGSYRISSSYGPRWGTTHGGLDMAAPYGTPIFAAGDGVVVAPVGMSGYGNVVVIEHADGTITMYAHASKLLVEPGEKVKAGQLVALVGSTGYSTGNHLHFEVRTGLSGAQLEPVGWLEDRGVAV
jgi:murein DD-endopeptidase MepM/ murein hydrolase activator NlpD